MTAVQTKPSSDDDSGFRAKSFLTTDQEHPQLYLTISLGFVGLSSLSENVVSIVMQLDPYSGYIYIYIYISLRKEQNRSY